MQEEFLPTLSPLIAMVVSKFSIAHGLERKNGGLVIQLHGEIKFSSALFPVTVTYMDRKYVWSTLLFSIFWAAKPNALW